ncbi:MAG: efflux transporter periplasmic adaptor subunit, partial [Flavobacteriaceae bacterium]|nr:efflux transporter periplasmic adaptor subunit [Flavobacteriaceae bacterium]
MKRIYSILLLSILLASCGEQKKNSVEKVLESDNLETIRKKRGELVNEQDAINEKIKLLDEKIATLDTV